MDCSALTCVSLPPSVRRIDMRTFQGCHSLHTVIIHGSIKPIGNLAFSGCDALRLILIPASEAERCRDLLPEALQTLVKPMNPLPPMERLIMEIMFSEHPQ